MQYLSVCSIFLSLWQFWQLFLICCQFGGAICAFSSDITPRYILVFRPIILCLLTGLVFLHLLDFSLLCNCCQNNDWLIFYLISNSPFLSARYEPISIAYHYYLRRHVGLRHQRKMYIWDSLLWPHHWYNKAPSVVFCVTPPVTVRCSEFLWAMLVRCILWPTEADGSSGVCHFTSYTKDFTIKNLERRVWKRK